MPRERFDTEMTSEGWMVKKEGAVVASATNQSSAEALAVKAALFVQGKGCPAHVVFHMESGAISEERTYGNDPEGLAS